MGGGRFEGGGFGVQGGCERRLEVFVKIQKKMGGGVGFFFGGVGFGGSGLKKMGGGRVGGGVRVDVNEELKFL